MPTVRQVKKLPKINSSNKKKRSKLIQSAPNLNGNKLSKELRLKKARELIDLPKLRPKTIGDSDNQKENVFFYILYNILLLLLLYDTQYYL